jgi:hypothetical protein
MKNYIKIESSLEVAILRLGASNSCLGTPPNLP